MLKSCCGLLFNMECHLLIIRLIILASVRQRWVAASCTETEWKCADGQCIESKRRCDNFPDCEDGSDENRCTGSVCPEGERECLDIHGTETCIGPNKKCDCGSTSQIPFGNITADNTLEGATASVFCDKGYMPTSLTVVCQETGLWSNAACTVKDCGHLQPLTNGKLTLTDPTNTTFGATVEGQYEAGFEPSASRIACLSTGDWETVTCIPVDCGQLPLIPFGNATLTVPDNSSYGSEAHIVCGFMYTPNVSTIMCLASGSWEAATCMADGKVTDGGPKEQDNTTLVLVLCVTLGFVFILLVIGVIFYIKKQDKKENEISI